MISPEKLIQGFRATASPPIIYIRLNKAINNPDSSLADIGTIISEDSALSARLLKLVNSSFYGFPQRIGSISEAVLLVGSKQVRDIALVTRMLHAFNGIPEDLINLESFWLHSLACGVGSKILAQEMGESEFEQYFVSGVLHDIGRMIMFSKIPDKSKTLIRRSLDEKRPLIELEREEIGSTHAEIGKRLMESWNLPLYFQEAAEFHHAPEMAGHFPLETAAVHIADVLAHSLQFGSSGEHFVPPLKNESWDAVKIASSKIPGLMEKIDKEVNAITWMIN